ncbi:TPA: type III secretion system central stalk protein YscO [Yersinia enterocolitica]|uniref:Type III secretion spans bacterial envelope protein (YscO) n=1 Tax=Yersinia enterocolitica subsp. palearctica serotype O:3 (strain DSM 13030 / CIP 106945 / Y11) TaxID=930944 RepID=A0A0H3NZW7_YERE1|nr:type III secretion system central stalk protein YscO [Yersinia enterocolitica]MDC5278328.1 type III secretion system central stalk protein YscO [Acinetobacter baumannii]ADZ44456.1 type III secretion system translocation protein [Yersinia enterocolitica subsp. palearctica 105.5R(r)]AJJ25619.1 type III secretion YscO family protein [Yersinia enterocolitica]ALG80862.1 preprotein translocase O [Yersinia enterocolitica]EKN3315055.1 type III secretion system central stalk protein YscO [Yersinia e
MIRRLHRVKVLRVERAEQAIKTQQACLQAAHRRHQEAVQTSQDYHLWRIDEEQRLFDQRKNTTLNCKDLEKWQRQIASLREKEANYELECAKLLECLANERERLTLCQKTLQQARHKENKFLELVQREDENELNQQHYQEEQEQEEFLQHHRNA